MTIEISKTVDVWTIFHNRPEVRNAMNALSMEGAYGAAHFSARAGRHGDFENI